MDSEVRFIARGEVIIGLQGLRIHLPNCLPSLRTGRVLLSHMDVEMLVVARLFQTYEAEPKAVLCHRIKQLLG